MKNQNINNLLNLVSKEKSEWLKKAQYMKENESWLDISFAIAIKILATLENNNKNNIPPKNQKEFANLMECSPQYVNKLLKGTENLQLETINRIENILNIKLIEVPKHEVPV